MSASILYKFRSATTFEALPLPGSSARLLDVKRAIVAAKKLDQGLEFDLSLRDATTNEEYTDEAQLLPRGTRLIVQRLPAVRGHGLLARLARQQFGGAAPNTTTSSSTTIPSNFYTIDSHAADKDEFVSAKPADDGEAELAALRAATDTGRTVQVVGVGGGTTTTTGGALKPPPRNPHAPPRVPRPNADPELRDAQAQPKKRATGIPRTFQSLTAANAAEGGEGPLLQPNAIGFAELLHRGGGQSAEAAQTQTLEYALKVTANEVPDYLQCALCGNVVRDAMILPWDEQGRTTCERCIRDALTSNGFTCPLTGIEGLSPDDLLPNRAIRKAAEKFVATVMAKMQEITQAAVDDEADVDNTAATLDDNAVDNGVLVSKKMAPLKKKTEDDDPFAAADDDFGGDVFAVGVAEEKPAEEAKDAPKPAEEAPPEAEPSPETKPEVAPKPEETKEEVAKAPTTEASPPKTAVDRSVSPAAPKPNDPTPSGRRERRRGPPVGYSMGPAGSARGPRDDNFPPRSGGGGGDFRRGDRYGGPREDNHDEGGGGGGEGGGGGGDSNSMASDRDRGNKRPRSGSEYDDQPPDDDRYNSNRGRFNDRYDDRDRYRNDDRRGGDYRGHDYRGGRGGRYNDRGGGFRGSRAGGRRGGFRGRGRY